MRRRTPLFFFLVLCAALGSIVLLALGVFRLGALDWQEAQKLVGLSSSDKNSRSGMSPYAKGGSRPNILLITIDTLRGDYLGINGHPETKTPNMDALARQGANFTLAITPFSQTNPAHSSLFTGAYPATHKSDVHCFDKISESVVTLAELLSQNGYTTSAIYSWPCFEGDFGLDRGFASYQGIYSKGASDDKYHDRGVDGRADLTTDGVLEWARQSPPSPYFLWVHYQDPHYPYTPPPPFDNMYDPDCQDCLDGSWESIDKIGLLQQLRPADVKSIRAKYAGEVSFTDQEIGRLLAGMKKAGLLDNTMVILTSDHGESLDDNDGVWFHPLIAYNSVVRVPLIVSYPPTIPAGKTVDTVVASFDIMPTVLELVGIPLPPQIEAESLWPLILGKEKEGEGGRRVFVQSFQNRIMAVVTDEWKLIRDFSRDETKLFRTKADPGELNDLAASNPEQVLALEEELRAWMTSHNLESGSSVK